MLFGVRQLQLLAHDLLVHRCVAAIVIQSMIRKWSVKKHLADMHHSARVIQVTMLLFVNIISSPFLKNSV